MLAITIQTTLMDIEQFGSKSLFQHSSINLLITELWPLNVISPTLSFYAGENGDFGAKIGLFAHGNNICA